MPLVAWRDLYLRQLDRRPVGSHGRERLATADACRRVDDGRPVWGPDRVDGQALGQPHGRPTIDRDPEESEALLVTDAPGHNRAAVWRQHAGICGVNSP